jgi:prepilin-type N-terminal cleavage/methylation domain-containing protein
MYMSELFQKDIGERLSNNLYPSNCRSSFALTQHDLSQTDRGLSLLEVLVVIVILTITTAAALPNLISWRAGMRLQGAINELLGDLYSAKTLAAKHNTTISVQFEPAESRYEITYVNADNQVVALKQETLPPELRIDSSHPDYSLTNHRMAFTSRGGATPGTLVVSNLAKKSRKIVVSSIGKIRTESLK